MSEISVAIDIGTSRTKVAWRDNTNQVNTLIWEGSPYFPSVFHLPADSKDILLGDEALEAMEDEFDGYIENLKREIIEGRDVPLTHEGRTETAEQLLVALFMQVRQALLEQVTELEGLLPELVVITVPGQTCMEWQNMLQHAAKEVGFLSHQIMDEPIAAARGWLMQQSINKSTLVVIDCGGGTTDWSVVQWNQGRVTRPIEFRVESMALGGMDVDFSLYQFIRETHNADSINRYPAPKLIKKLRAYKEKALAGETLKAERIAGHKLNLDAQIIKNAYRSSFIEPLLKQCIPYLEKAREHYEDLKILLVGGGQTQELQRALEKAISEIDVVNVVDPGLAVIVGALYVVQSMEQLETESDEQYVQRIGRLAEQGDATAQFNLGVSYDHGQGNTQDDTKAVEWYRKAAEQGDATAQNNLGYSYVHGQGIVQDYIQAVEWFQKAAEQGHASAQLNLGYRYNHGQGVTQDDTKAVEWYRKAAEQGHATAQNNLGCCYYSGQGVIQDKKKAVEWYRKAVEQGDATAQNNLENLLKTRN